VGVDHDFICNHNVVINLGPGWPND